MLLNINEIKIKHRVRKDLGDLTPLKDSLRRFGLLNPITVNSRNELIAGQRRLEAAKQLGWQNINVQVLDINDKISQLEIELEENTQRSDFSDEELLEGYTLLEKYRNPGLFRRLMDAIKSFFFCISESSAEKREKKTKNSLLLSLFLVFGCLLIVVAAVLTKYQLISSVLLTFLNVLSIISITVGIIFFIRYICLRKS